MSVTIGPSTWWVRTKEAADYYARICPLGTILPDGSAVWCRTLGQAWIVAPSSTQIADQWASGQYNYTLVGGVGGAASICCICEWSNVCNRLVCCGFNPCDWFIPCRDILFNSYNSRGFWDTFSSSATYWSSSEYIVTGACYVNFSTGQQINNDKSCTYCVRSVRCINL
jgi:hypothetical protein